jgi:hypothetical protein
MALMQSAMAVGRARPAGETVNIALANPAGGAMLGVNATATLWIVDDE